MPRRPEFGMAVAMVLVLGAVPVSQTGWELSRGDRPQCFELFDRFPSETSLREYEADLEDRSWLTQYVRPVVQRFRLRLLGDLAGKLVAGRNEWLFYEPGVDYLVERPPAGQPPGAGANAAFRAICSFHTQLSARRIQLLVVIVPGKATVYPDRLTGRFQPGRVVESRTKAFVERLNAAGIETVDLTDTFSQLRASGQDEAQPLFLARDTHWTGSGVRSAASAIARRVRQLGWLDLTAPARTEVYTTRRVHVVRRGDLTKMASSLESEQTFDDEQLEVLQVIERVGGAPYRDHSQSSVLLIGDSFARIYESDTPKSSGLAAHLAHQLDRPLTSLVNDGGASTLVRQQLARRIELLEGKSLVIWEFVERDLRYGLEGWQEVRLPNPKSD